LIGHVAVAVAAHVADHDYAHHYAQDHDHDYAQRAGAARGVPAPVAAA